MRLIQIAITGFGTLVFALIAMAMSEPAIGAGLHSSPDGAVGRSMQLPKLTSSAAERFARSGLRKKFDWFESANTKVHCNRRKSRTRISCRTSFWIGDSSAKGWVTAWYRWRNGEVWWWTSGRLEVLDEYCYYALDKPRSQCTDKVRW